MCHFITVGVRDAGVSILEDERRRRNGLGVVPTSNPHLKAIFSADDRLFWITHGGCSCDLVLVARKADSGEGSLEKERDRYRKKGWSEAKIARAMEAKHKERSTVPRGQRDDTPPEMLGDLLNRLLAVKGGARIFVHQYNGACDEEDVVGQVGKPLSILSVIEGLLPEDVLVDLLNDRDPVGGNAPTGKDQ